jgi:Domain of unknown function (DUF1707)/FHA domain
MPDAQPVLGLRASDAERDEVVARLTEEFAAGRLSHDTFLFRMHAVLEARHQSELPRVLADLPGAPGSVPDPASPGAAALAKPGQDGRPRPAWPGLAGQQPPAARPAGARGLVTRLRAALPRMPASAATFSGEPPPPARSARRTPARRLTAGMPRAGAEARRPAPLQFPRGAGPAFSIGRAAACDLTIADMTVSRVHARLERTRDGWMLTDLASTNGTRVNGWLVRDEVPVRAGDLVSFGKAEYWLSAPAEAG